MDVPDTHAARMFMVDSQVRPNKVNDPRILGAMRALPRERFLPSDRAPLAYADEDVKLGGGRVLMQPMVMARLIQLAAPRAGERALVVAAGAGYGAAILAACGATVTALEDDPALLALARAALPALAPGVTLAEGPPEAGWPAGAPYDIVLIEGAVEDVPPALAAQLRPGTGRLVGVRVAGGGPGQAVLGEITPAGLAVQPVFDATITPLPALRRVAGFVF
ncbi:MAG: protein-L-isoaspartate O-methyltransferase [Rhodospirillales bacterium]|nr:protein-L-isoaspartate O-methyltransferase [Rhodospirillales bacterium]